MIVKVTPHQKETITGPCSPLVVVGGGDSVSFIFRKEAL